MIEKKDNRWDTLKMELQRVPGYEHVLDLMFFIEEMIPYERILTGYGGMSTTPTCPVCKKIFQMSSYRYGTCGKICEEIKESGSSKFLEEIYEKDPDSESVQVTVRNLHDGGITMYDYMLNPRFKCVSCGKIIPEGEEFIFTLMGSEIYCMRCEPGKE